MFQYLDLFSFKSSFLIYSDCSSSFTWRNWNPGFIVRWLSEIDLTPQAPNLPLGDSFSFYFLSCSLCRTPMAFSPSWRRDSFLQEGTGGKNIFFYRLVLVFVLVIFFVLNYLVSWMDILLNRNIANSHADLGDPFMQKWSKRISLFFVCLITPTAVY